MSLVKLVSAQPIAFGKNALLQKRYENQCSHLAHEHRATQRKIQGTEEQCVVSAYGLLMEAEKYEQEKIDRGEIKYDRSTGRYSAKPPQPKTRRPLQKVRPMTAGHGASTPRVQVDNNRPSTASASLGKQSASVISMIEIDNEPMIETQMSHEKRNTPITSTPRPTVQQQLTANVNSTELKSNSYTQRTSDLHVIIPKNPVTTQNNSPNNASLIRPQERDSRLLTDGSTFRPSSRLTSTQEVSKSDKGLQNGKIRRPRTADDFRRKCDENEMTTYWNKRVTKLIKRWNLEDMSDPFLTSESMPHSDETFHQEPPSPVLEPPSRTQEPETDATLKTKKFIQTYGSHFRSLLRPNSAPFGTESKTRRRPVQIQKGSATHYKRSPGGILSQAMVTLETFKSLLDTPADLESKQTCVLIPDITAIPRYGQTKFLKMPVKHLSLRALNQGVNNRNAKVLRRYEDSCKSFEKDYHTAMRGHRAILADDLQFAYYLLKQMERYEDEKLTKRNVVVRCSHKIPNLKINISRPTSRLVPDCPLTDRPVGNREKREDVIPTVRPLTAPAAGRSSTTVTKKNVTRRYNQVKNKAGRKARGKPGRSRSAPVPSHQEGDEDDEPVPPTPLARFTRTYEYNRKVLLCRSRQEELRLERIREAEDGSEDESNYDDLKEDDFEIEEEDSHETRKHDYWMWKIDVLFEKWRRNDRELDDDDIYSLYEEDLDEEIFDDNQIQSYIKPGIRQINTTGRTQLVSFTKNKVLKYRWAFAGERFNKGADDTRKNRRKFVTAELSSKERQKIREEAETKCRRLKRMVQESDYLRNEVYLMAPFYKTKQALIAKVAAKQPALFQ